MFRSLVSQINSDSVNEILKNTDVQKSIKSILNTGTPVTDQKFVFLGFAITLSLYLSGLSREITQKIIEDFSRLSKAPIVNGVRKSRKVQIVHQRIKNLLLMILMDWILWFFLIIPCTIISSFWFISLVPTKFPFVFLRWWIFIGFLVVVICMFIAHFYQFRVQITIIDKQNFDRQLIPCWEIWKRLFFVK
jgi:hypothetical protein